MNTRILPALLIGALVLVLAGCTTRVVTEGSEKLYTVTASGTGTTSAAPDLAQMYFGVTIIDADARMALATAGDAAEAITDAVKQAGVATEDIQTANISVYPQYTYGESRATTISGYSATVQVRAKLRDFATIGDVITAASAAGANEISGPTFTLSDDAAARAESITGAVEDARAQAETMASAAGKSLGEVVSMSQTGVTVPVLYGERAAYDTAQSAVPVEPGQLDVTANVTVVFELK